MADNDVSSSSSSSGGHVAAQTIVGGWFWQAAEGHNYRWSKAVRSITRYYESAPLEGDILKLVVEYLRMMTGVTSFELNHKLYQPGGTWAAKDVWFQTVPGEKWEGTQSTKVRIYQTLICQVDGSADGPYTVENGCRYLVKHTFYWDVAEIPTVPAGTSGVSYTLQGVSRDRETGLFSCVLEERTRVEQDIPLYDSARTIFEKRQEAQYLGVKQSDVESTGLAASASGGVLVERRLTKNEDCTTNIENIVTTEESVDDATVEYRKTLRGTVKTKVDRDQSAALDESGIVVGETRRSEKTPGGLYNNTTVKLTNEAAGKIAESCTKTIFEHEHQTLENVVSEPSESSVSSAAGGVIHTKQIRKTEEGTFDVTTTDRKEASVDDATVEYRKTIRGTVKTKADRGQSSALEQSGMVVGETRRSEKTPGGLYNNTIVKVTNEAAGKIAESCTKTIFEHEHQILENVVSEPSESSVGSAAGGIIHTKQIRKTEEGTFDVTTTDRTEASVDDATVEFRKTLRGTVKTKVDRCQSTALDQSGMVVGETRRSEKTPGGLYNNTTIVRLQGAAGMIASACVKNGGGIMHQHQTVENVSSVSSSSASSASANYQRQITVRRTEDGTYDVERTVTKWEPESESESWTDQHYHYVHKVYVNSIQPQIPTSGDAISCSFNINSHGTFDGSWTVRNDVSISPGETLQWSIGPSDVQVKYYYFKKDGKMYSRLITGKKYQCGGKLPHVCNEIQSREMTGSGDNRNFMGFPAAGWRNNVSGSYDHAQGVCYKVTSIGPESSEDSAST